MGAGREWSHPMHVPRRTCRVALVTLLGVLAACGATGPRLGRATHPQSAVCPAANPPSPRSGAAGSGTGADLVPPRPLAAVICQYGPGHAAMAPRIVFRRNAADGLAALLDDASPPPRRDRRCSRPSHLLPVLQLIRFSYAAGPQVSAQLDYSDCMIAVVTAHGRLGILVSPAQDDLFAYTSVPPGTHDAGSVTPDLIGLSAAAAHSRARHNGLALQQDGAVLDPRVRTGTVVFQSLSAGTPMGPAGPGQQVSVIIAVHAASACRPPQLGLDYIGGGAGAGSDFGTVILRDVSAAPCRLPGPLRLAGLDATSRRVTQSVRYPVATPAVLSPDAPRVTQLTALSPGELVGVMVLSAEYRDDPSSPDGICAARRIVPAIWRIQLPSGASVTVPNSDSLDTGRQFAPDGALLTCRGELDTPSPVEVGQSDS